MLYDSRRDKREKRRLNAMKRIEQLDKVIAELDGTARGSAGWCKGDYATLIRSPGSFWPEWLLSAGETCGPELKSQHCLVGAIRMHVKNPRTRFFGMVGKYLPDGYRTKYEDRPSRGLIAFNDAQDDVGPVLALLRKVREREAQLAGMTDG